MEISPRFLSEPTPATASSSAAAELASSAGTPASTDELLDLTVRFGGKEFHLQFRAAFTVLQLKAHLAELTHVLPRNQKLTSVSFKGKLPPDGATLGSFPVRLKQILLIGTPENEKLIEPPPDPDVLVDFDYDNIQAEVLKTNEENLRRLRSKLDQRLDIPMITAPRKGKKLLVLDVDYTLFDYKLFKQQAEDSARPFLHELLSAVYPFYDLVAWSQTNWRWLEIKLTQLNLLQNPNYQFTFVLDQSHMFEVQSKWPNGEVRVHEVKALAVIWTRFVDFYNPKNTVHIDDLSRNFALNPQNGLKIKAFKNARESRHSDRELLCLRDYLLSIAKLDDLSKLNHTKWKDYCPLDKE